MTEIYQAFLRAPKAAHLAPNAALNYITTTTTIVQPDAIIKHLESQARQVEKKAEKILSCTEASNGVCLETETTYEFKSSGGLILPNMDAAMLVDTIAVVPMVHVVSLDANGKISQIRLHWDQGTVLKQVEAIGKTGRNWPIRDGQAQTKLIAESVNAKGQMQASAGAEAAGRGRQASGRGTEDFTKRLFSPEPEEDPRSNSRSTSSGVAPRQSAKPQPRQWGELFAGEEDADAAASYGSPPGVRSPYQPILKAGAGQNYKPNRLFDEDEDDGDRNRSPERKKADPSKYEHFEFGERQPQKAEPLGIRGKKQQSNWDFEDFNTPAKHVSKPDREQERHFGHGIDEDDQPSPPKRDIKHIPRKDAKAHFDIQDDSPAGRERPLQQVTNVNAARRNVEDNPHYRMKDTSSPSNENFQPEKPKSNTNAPLKPRSDMHSNWDMADMEKEAGPVKKIYKTAGDGMGGRAGARFWEIGSDEGVGQYGGKGGQKQVYKTAGNGMGGRKGTGLGWSIGDPDAE